MRVTSSSYRTRLPVTTKIPRLIELKD